MKTTAEAFEVDDRGGGGGGGICPLSSSPPRGRFPEYSTSFRVNSSGELEGCPILSNRVHWKMGHNNSIDSIDLSSGEFLYSIGKVQPSIGLLHFISET